MDNPLMILHRVYDVHPPFNDCYLIDRLWPRGISKIKLIGVIWLKEVAPSSDLRKWYHQHLDEWEIFYQTYQQELENNPAVVPLYSKLQEKKAITLLYSSKDEKHNHAIVLRDFLDSKLKKDNSTS